MWLKDVPPLPASFGFWQRNNREHPDWEHHKVTWFVHKPRQEGSAGGGIKLPRASLVQIYRASVRTLTKAPFTQHVECRTVASHCLYNCDGGLKLFHLWDSRKGGNSTESSDLRFKSRKKNFFTGVVNACYCHVIPLFHLDPSHVFSSSLTLRCSLGMSDFFLVLDQRAVTHMLLRLRTSGLSCYFCFPTLLTLFVMVRVAKSRTNHRAHTHTQRHWCMLIFLQKHVFPRSLFINVWGKSCWDSSSIWNIWSVNHLTSDACPPPPTYEARQTCLVVGSV